MRRSNGERPAGGRQGLALSNGAATGDESPKTHFPWRPSLRPLRNFSSLRVPASGVLKSPVHDVSRTSGRRIEALTH